MNIHFCYHALTVGIYPTFSMGSKFRHFSEMVGQTDRAADPAKDTSSLEQEIDQIVYRLYGLAEKEIAVVEGAVGKGEQ